MRVMRNHVTAPPDFWIMSAQSGANCVPAGRRPRHERQHRLDLIVSQSTPHRTDHRKETRDDPLHRLDLIPNPPPAPTTGRRPAMTRSTGWTR
jgi:hypothetical protein